MVTPAINYGSKYADFAVVDVNDLLEEGVKYLLKKYEKKRMK